MLIDAHCHVLSSEYDDVNEIIKETLNSEVDKIIINGYDLESSKEAVFLAEKYDNVYAAVGIGPQNIDEVTTFDIEQIENLCSSKKVVAIGEIGLDYYWTIDMKQKQIEIFESMLTIAKNKKLPVIIHSRKAIFDTYNLVKEYNVTGIMHCFSGSSEMAKEFIKLGFLIGVGGVVTFKNSKEIKDVVSSIELDDIALETDSPYLTPEPFRGRKNIPSHVIYVVDKIADLKGVTRDVVIFKTSNAVTSKFDL